jgi:uncharacterized protein (TIGR00255 family)
MRSMTGYGLGEVSLGSARITIEARSLNHRYLEVRVRTSAELADHGFFLEQQCREQLSRGRYDISARWLDSEQASAELDVPRARRIHAALTALATELTPGATVPVGALTPIVGLFNPQSVQDPEATRSALGQALKAAISALDTMRESEGNALCSELGSRLQSAQGLRRQIADRGPDLVKYYQNRLQERLTRLLSGSEAQVDPSRLQAEVALLADKSDVTEELVRLGSHFEQFSALLAAAEPVGRRLDFLLQEIGRETNTIGSKCQDASLSHLVVELKTEVERMREQVQNVE